MVELPEPYRYSPAYIILPLPNERFAHFPDTIEYEGYALLKKTEFHVSLVRIRDLFEVASEEDILSFFNDFVNVSGISLAGFGDTFRFVEEGERKTVVLPCEMHNLDAFFTEFNKKFGVDVPTQPAHVTLYTLQKDVGIGIPSPEKMAQTKPVSIPELSQALEKLITDN